MKGKKRVFFMVTGIITLALTAAAMLCGLNMHKNYLASKDISSARSKLVEENKRLENQRDILKKDVGAKTDDTDRKEALNKEITDLTGEIETMKKDIEEAKKTLSEAKSRTIETRKTLDTLQSGMNMTRGSSKQIDNGGSLSCPAAIEPGRYVAEGGGIVTVTAATGSARVSEDLLSIDTGSYTFDLAAGESVSADSGAITLTELK